jgi:hypothetical protein
MKPWILVSLVAACGGSPPAPAPIAHRHEPAPTIDLMLVHARTLGHAPATGLGGAVVFAPAVN